MSQNIRSLAALAAAALAACAGAPQQDAPRQALPRYEATITRTAFGIPHIEARDFAGLGFGAAYARAQDNLCLMADAYVSAAGERSKFFGAGGDALVGLRGAKNLDSDAFNLAVHDLPGLRAGFARASADFQSMVGGWVAGYNRYLRDHAERLPAPCAGTPWLREITLDDVLRSMNSFSVMSSSGAFATQLVNAAPPAGDAQRSAAPGRLDVAGPADFAGEAAAPLPDVALLGSNGWAFGGDATRNGRGLVLANPHFPWIGPNRFYEQHLTIPGTIDVAGAAIVMLPYVGIGFNRDVAWTHTVDMAAHMTLFRLALDPADPTAYFVDGAREAMTRREISVQDKDGSRIARTVYGTRFGPVISAPGSRYEWTRTTAYALADANNGNLRSGDTYLDMARARRVEDLREALARHLGAPFINTLAADRHGTALYADITAVPNVPAARFADCGTVEDRLPGQLQDLYVLDGSRSACVWETSPGTAAPGLMPASDMATLYRRDYVQNSNDSYRWSNPAAQQRLGPLMGRDPGLGSLRTQSGLQEISRVLQSGKFDIELAAQTMLGNRSFAAGLALPALRRLCERPGAPAPACAALGGWDGVADLDSRGALLFSLFWGKVGTRGDIWRTPFDPDDMIGTPRDLVTDGKVGDELLAALAAAADDMQQRGLPPDAPLRQAQFAVRGAERIPISGVQHGGVLNYTKPVPVADGYAVIFGASYMQAVTFDDHGPVARAILTYSQSADPASPHYADQTREFSNKRLHPFPYAAADVAAAALGEPLTIRQ